MDTYTLENNFLQQSGNKKNKRSRKKFDTNICDSNMTFQECELAILRNAIDESDIVRGKVMTNNEDVKRMLEIVESFIIEKKVLLYGGTAINNILPAFAQFYDRNVEIPDYDFYSPTALEHAKELADIFYKAGYIEVEAKAGVHMGTFKVYVNFIPIADITQMHQQLYKQLFKDAVVISRIHYTPPNYLRMSMYLELSRPIGDVSRWEKVLKRLILLNKYFPFKPENDCFSVDFHSAKTPESSRNDELYIETRECFINQGVVFFGGYATSLYSRYMPAEQQKRLKRYPDFDVLSDEPEKCAIILKEHLQRFNFKKIKLVHHDEIGDIIPQHIEVRVEDKTVAFIYKPIACHSYNTLTIKNKEVNVATIDTILTFYLSFWYADLKYYDKDRLICMAKYLFDIEQHNRLNQRGLLKRFSIKCYGKQMTLTDLRSEKAKKYKELIKNRKSKEYEMWFLKYYPHLKYKKGDDFDEKEMEDQLISEEEVEKSLQRIEEKEREEEEKASAPEILKKREKSFIERVIGTPRKSAKRVRKTSNRVLNFFNKTRKNRSSEFLF